LETIAGKISMCGKISRKTSVNEISATYTWKKNTKIGNEVCGIKCL